ncbi:putative D-xylose utilization operon transcriptional repressor [Acinetobacter calcoaceticus]
MKKQIKRQTVVELAADALREKIILGEVKGGEPLRQTSLAEELGVSRIPIREAIRLLASEGLIELIPHKGAYVSILSDAEVEEFFDLRIKLEPWLFSQSILRITEAEIEQAEEAIEMSKNSDLTNWGELNWKFHEAIYRPAQKPNALAMIKLIHERSERYLRLQITANRSFDKAIEDHQRLIECCKNKDVEKGVSILTQHIEEAKKIILELFRNRT